MGAGIAAFLLKGDLDVEVTKNMEAGMTNYGNGAEFDGVTKAWDIVQENYECCGVQVGSHSTIFLKHILTSFNFVIVLWCPGENTA